MLRFLIKISDIPEVPSAIKCKDDSEYKLHDGIFVCEIGNALIDYRIFFVSPNAEPVALFIQVKHSEWTVESANITFASVSSWYQNCQLALKHYRGKFRVVLAIVTNRKVDLPENCTPSAPSWPQDLVLISHDELATFLGPLAHRGLLAANDL